MAVITYKPTSPGRRSKVSVSRDHLYKGAPHAALVEAQSRTGGRNNAGRITTRHIGGGHKQHYRIIDFKRDKEGIASKVERIEYDPNRTAHIALLCYADGERRYIIAPKGVQVGDQLMSGRDAPIKVGNTLPLRNIPIGTTVHCIEMKPGKKARSRAAPAPRPSSLPASRATRRFVFAPVRCARCRPTAVQPSARSATASTTSPRSARPVRSVGLASVRPSAAW